MEQKRIQRKHAWSMSSILPHPLTTLSEVPKKQRTPKRSETPKKYRKKAIPVAFREQIWIRDCGRVFDSKCRTPWCQNRITVFDFQSGHNIPESKGGPTKPENLVPLCSRCNQSMGDRYTFDEWAALASVQEEPLSIGPVVTEVSPSTKRWWWCC